MTKTSCWFVRRAPGAGRWRSRAGRPSPVDLQRTLKGVEDRYNKIQTLQVKFTESYTSRGRTRTESGTLYLRKKGKMRWEYSTGKLFVSDGKFIYSYYPDEHRAEKMSMKETDDMRAPLAFLLGDVDFERDFGEYHSKPQDGGALITALPKSDKFPYTEVTFLVARRFDHPPAGSEAAEQRPDGVHVRGRKEESAADRRAVRVHASEGRRAGRSDASRQQPAFSNA